MTAALGLMVTTSVFAYQTDPIEDESPRIVPQPVPPAGLPDGSEDADRETQQGQASPAESSAAPPAPPAQSSAPQPTLRGAAPEASETGIATLYHDEMEGRLTASGEQYARDEMTAAHASLPFGTLVRVTHLDTSHSIEVRINDRWSASAGRVLNLSRRAAERLGFGRAGQARVRLDVVSLGSGRMVRRASTLMASKPVPPRVEEVPHNDAGRLRFCQNQADILGLGEPHWRAHVLSCLAARKPA